MAYHVQGKNVILRALKSGEYRLFACATSLRFSVQTDLVETSTTRTGPFRTFAPLGLSEWSVTLGGVLYLRDQSEIKNFALESVTEQVRNNGYDITITFTDEEGYVQTISGSVFVPLTEIFRETGTAAKYNIEFKGSGAFDISVLPPSPSLIPRMRYIYTASGGESYFTDATLIGRTIEWVDRSDSALDVVTTGSATSRQTLYTIASGRFDFDPVLNTGEIIIILYS